MRILKKLGLAKMLRKIRGVLITTFDWLGSLMFFEKTKDINPESIKKILIIRTDRIGDLILSTPAIRSVRKLFPSAQIHLLVSLYTRDLVVNNPNVDGVLILGVDPIEQNYDLAIALYRGIYQNYLSFKSGAKYRLGFYANGGGFFLTHTLKNESEILDQHEVKSSLALVCLLGKTSYDLVPEVSITPQGERYAEEFYKKHSLLRRVAVIHPGARQEYIRWREEGFASVADSLINEKKMKVILIGSKNENKLVNEVKALMKETPIEAVGLQLTELVSLIKRADLFIGGSSGPMHIAAALLIPTVAIFGSKHPQDSFNKWRPLSQNSIVVYKDPGCSNCHPSDCKTFKCMELITPNDVIQAAYKLMEGKSGN